MGRGLKVRLGGRDFDIVALVKMMHKSSLMGRQVVASTYVLLDFDFQVKPKISKLERSIY